MATQGDFFNLIHRISIEEKNIQTWLDIALEAYRRDPEFFLPDTVKALKTKYGRETKVVVLGIANFSHLFIREAREHINIVAVVDDFRAGRGFQFEGLPIITSEQLANRDDRSSIVTLNGCIDDHARRYFKNLALHYDIPQLTYEQGARWLKIEKVHNFQGGDDLGPAIASGIGKLLDLSAKFSDEYSRTTLFHVLLAHLTCDLEWIKAVSGHYSTTYFRSGLWSPTWHEKFADCGASVGESTTAFIDATNGHFDRVWMFEPDRFNIEKLKTFVDQYEKKKPCRSSGPIDLYGCALGEFSAKQSFFHQGGSGGMLMSSTAGSDDENTVQVSPLDELLDESPTLIKMDLEGTELAALKGARRHIEQHRPKLAIAAYHRSTDLLDIPDFVLSIRPDYRVGLRHHSETRYDTCLYFY